MIQFNTHINQKFVKLLLSKKSDIPPSAYRKRIGVHEGTHSLFKFNEPGFEANVQYKMSNFFSTDEIESIIKDIGSIIYKPNYSSYDFSFMEFSHQDPNTGCLPHQDWGHNSFIPITNRIIITLDKGLTCIEYVTANLVAQSNSTIMDPFIPYIMEGCKFHSIMNNTNNEVYFLLVDLINVDIYQELTDNELITRFDIHDYATPRVISLISKRNSYLCFE